MTGGNENPVSKPTANPQQAQAETLHHEAIQALTAGRLNEGISLLEKALAVHPKFSNALNDLGTAYWQAGRPGLAEKAYARAIQADPKNPYALNGYGTFLLEQFRHSDADPLLSQAYALKPDYHEIANNLGLLRYRQRRLQEAERLFLQAMRLNPSWANPYVNLGRVLFETERRTLAEKAFRDAVLLNPNHAAAWSELGDLCAASPGEEAFACLNKSLALDPSSALTWTRLINFLEKRNRLDEAQEKLQEAKARFPTSPGTVICEIRLLRRQGRHAESVAVVEKHIQRIKNAPVSSVTVNFFFEASQSYERVNDTDKAFECITLANRGQAKLEEVPGNAAECRRVMLHTREAFTKELTQPSCALPENGRPVPVFLVGFPRSGTTLLDQILTSHPDIEVAEEKPAVDNALFHFIETYGDEFKAEVVSAAAKAGRSAWYISNPCYPAFLDRLRTEDIEVMRNRFYATHGWEKGKEGKKILIDKLPLNLLFVGFIKRIFPDAKFLLALRHPCDSVLSCYMQQFSLNPYMVRFLDLKDAARFYDEAFSLWDHYKSIMDLDFHTIHYEDVVANFQPTVAGALDFLGVGWNDAVLKYDETAKKRSLIATPSYHQVTEKLYTRASGRWQRYRKHMEPVLDILAPHALKHGYSMEASDKQK